MSANTETRRQSLANWKIDDPGAGGVIPGDRTGTCAITTATAETRTVDSPSKVNLHLTLNLETDGGTCTLTVTNYIGSDDSLVLDDAGDFVVLQSVYTGTGTLGWKAVASNDLENMSVQTVTATTVSATTVSATTVIGTGALTASASPGNSGFNYVDRDVVTQSSSITTGVEVDALAGIITTVSSTLAAAARAEFVVTNSAVAVGDIIVCTADTAGAGTPVAYSSLPSAGGFTMVLENKHASAALDAVVTINFAVIKTSA